MPEEEEEEEQEEDESVPDLTGFVLEDMKLYVHIVYILSGQLDEWICQKYFYYCVTVKMT